MDDDTREFKPVVSKHRPQSPSQRQSTISYSTLTVHSRAAQSSDDNEKYLSIESLTGVKILCGNRVQRNTVEREQLYRRLSGRSRRGPQSEQQHVRTYQCTSYQAGVRRGRDRCYAHSEPGASLGLGFVKLQAIGKSALLLFVTNGADTIDVDVAIFTGANSPSDPVDRGLNALVVIPDIGGKLSDDGVLTLVCSTRPVDAVMSKESL